LPIYEYECRQCGTTFERKQSFSDEPVASCPRCAGKARRVIHAVPVVFKGSGFYCTDHGRASSSLSAGKDRDAEAKSEAKSEAKPQAKPEAKTEAKAEAKASAKPEESD
jgi:putative FmdB family regulatory protein